MTTLQQVSVNNHRYYSDGTRYYPSPTTVLKLYFDPMFKKWSQNPDNLEYRNKRMIVGSRVHEIVNSRILGTHYECQPMDDNFGILEMSAITEDHLRQSEIVLSEQSVYNDSVRIAGTFDYLVKDAYGYTLLDLKTVDNEKKVKSKAVLDGHFMQLAAYHTGVKQCFPEYPINRWQLMIVSPTDIKLHEVTDRSEMVNYIKDFVSLRNKYQNLYGK